MDSFGGDGPWVSFPQAGPLLVLGEHVATLSSDPSLSLHGFLVGCVSLGLDRPLFLEAVAVVSSMGCCCPLVVSGTAAEAAVDGFFVVVSCDNAVSESTVSCVSFSTMTLGGVLSLTSPDLLTAALPTSSGGVDCRE